MIHRWNENKSRFNPLNIAWLATLRYALALLWPTIPGWKVSGRALTKRERDRYKS